MTLSVLYIGLVAGFLLGFMYASLKQTIRATKQQEAKDAEERIRLKGTPLYETLESALDSVKASYRVLYPDHEPYCKCAYCEIKLGALEDRPSVTQGIVDWQVMYDKANARNKRLNDRIKFLEGLEHG